METIEHKTCPAPRHDSVRAALLPYGQACICPEAVEKAAGYRERRAEQAKARSEARSARRRREQLREQNRYSPLNVETLVFCARFRQGSLPPASRREVKAMVRELVALGWSTYRIGWRIGKPGRTVDEILAAFETV